MTRTPVAGRPDPEPRGGGLGAAWLGAVFGLALALRLGHAWAVARSPFASLLVGDAAGYDRWAHEVAAGGGFGVEPFYQAPLYPFFLGALYALVSDALPAVRAVHSAIGALSCVLVAAAACRFVGRNAGVLAGLGTAVYAPLIHLEGLVQKSVLDVFFVSLTLLLLARYARAPGPARAAGVGFACGCLALTRENALVVAPVIAGWMLLLPGRSRRPGARELRSVSMLALALLAAIAPATLHNAWASGELHLVTSQLGPNLYIGNHPEADGRYRPLVPYRGSVSFERDDARRLAERAEGRSLTPGEVSRYWTERALAFALEQPEDWMRLTARKLGLAANAVEVADGEDQYTFADASPVLAATGWLDFGVIAPLATVAAFACRRRRRELSVLYGILGAYLLSVVAFHVSARYRLPLVPVVILLAAGGFVGLPELWRTASRRRLAACAAATLSVAGLCRLPLVDVPRMRAVTHLNHGRALQDLGDLSAARAAYRQALDRDPEGVAAHVNLGLLDLADGRGDDAESHMQAALAVDPDSFEAHYNLAAIRVREERWDEARLHFLRCTELRPESPDPHYALAIVAIAAGDPPAARRRLAKVLELAPSHERARRLLGELEALARP